MATPTTLAQSFPTVALATNPYNVHKPTKPRVSKAVPGEPAVFSDCRTVRDLTPISDRLVEEQEVIHQVSLWLASIGMRVQRGGHRVVGTYRDMRIEFWYLIDDSGDLHHSDVHKNWRVTYNNTSYSSATISNISSVRMLATDKAKFDSKSDFRERARMHMRLTGKKLSPTKAK